MSGAQKGRGGGGGGGGEWFGFQVTGMIEWGKNKNPKESKGFQKSLVKDEEEQKQEDQDLGQLWLTNQCQ